jgi:hypothetical protein
MPVYESPCVLHKVELLPVEMQDLKQNQFEFEFKVQPPRPKT